jgi:flagellar assembly protein FliH
MLSRVIAARIVPEVDAQPFTPAPLSRSHAAPPVWADCAPPAEPKKEAPDESDQLRAEINSLRDALRSLEGQLSSAKSEAFDAGRRQGQQHAQQELAPIVEKMKQSIADTVSTRAAARHQAEHDLVELALRIAKRILHREIATDPNSLAALARVVFERMTRAESYTLTIHPQFLTAVQSVLSGKHIATVRIEPDPNCSPGTFIIRSAEGTIDASIDTQLEEIGRGLADRLGPA